MASRIILCVHFLQRSHNIFQNKGLHTVRIAAEIGLLQRAADSWNKLRLCFCDFWKRRDALSGSDGLCICHMGQKLVQQGVKFSVCVPADVSRQDGDGPVSYEGVFVMQKGRKLVKIWIPGADISALRRDLLGKGVGILCVFPRRRAMQVSISTINQYPSQNIATGAFPGGEFVLYY